MSISWFLRGGRANTTRARLFCLPYAGGSAAVYRTWSRLLPADLEVLPVQLAGRGWRIREAPVADLAAIADQLVQAVAPLADLPFAVFGHSMGSWLGFELVRRLEARGHQPVCLFASGRQGPSMGGTQPPMAHLDDAGFVQEVQTRYGGIPVEIMQEPEVLALLLPALRADIAALEHYRPAEAPIATPIHAFVGATDTVVPEPHAATWATETTAAFSLRTFPGGHFYFEPDPRPLLDAMYAALEIAHPAPSLALMPQ